jgi:serine/threonine-protein kinase
VAIKVILDVFAADPDRVARFQREAKVLASINHPHIAALYGMEQSGAQHFLVMELVEGQTLAERLLRGLMPIEETLAIALQIADALEAAHEKGIVHRDLKPANVKITPDDRVKVLDFGLAKAIETEATAASVANSPTLSMMASQAGVILGTAAYMSPEQAKGFPADHRSDVFSFGSVLFEMLSGRQPFPGDTAPEMLASVLVRDADLTRLPQDLNPRLSELVRRCLEKQPKRRWQAIGDVRAEIDSIARAPRTEALPAGVARPPRSMWRRALPAVIAAVFVGALAGAAAWRFKPAASLAVVRFAVTLPANERFTAIGRHVVAISPDASVIAYVANRRINLRPIRELHGAPLHSSETREGVSSPVFSPDSKSVAFYSIGDGALKRMSLTGGASVTLATADNPMGISWGADGIVYAQASSAGRSLLKVPVSGGKPQVLVTLEPNVIPQGPQMLPDGETVLFTLGTNEQVGPDRWDNAQIVVQSVTSGTRKLVINGGSDARYLATGHIAYAIGGTIYAVPFDVRTLTVTGDPFPILEGVRRAAAGITGMADFSVSANGALAYVPGPAGSSGGVAVALADQRGGVSLLKLPPGPYLAPRATRDGKRVALETTDGKTPFVAVYEVSGSATLRRITFGAPAGSPVWSADGKRLAFQYGPDGDRAVFWQAGDVAGAPERLTKPGAGEVHVPQSWSGDVLLFDVVKGSDVSLWQISLKDRKATAFGNVRSATETGATFSPNGRWVAYSTTEAGATNMFVQPFPATGDKHMLVKTNAGSPHHAIWSPQGDALFYVAAPGVFERVSVATGATVSFGHPENIPRPFQGGPPGSRRLYDMMPDSRILGIVTPGEPGEGVQVHQIYVVLNWFEDLKARMSR